MMGDRLKIAFVGTAYPYRGGLAAFNERLARALQQAGHEVHLYTFTLQYPSLLFPGKTQLSSEEAPTDIEISRSVNTINPINWYGTGSMIADGGYDLVITKYWIPFVAPSLGTILRRIRTRSPRTKFVSILDNIVPHERRVGDRVLTKYYISIVDGFVSMSQSVMKDLSQFDANKPRLYSPHPIFDNFGDKVERAEALDFLGLDSSYRYMLFFGFIRDYKGLDLLLDAFADERFRTSDIRLIIAGEYYANRDKYQAQIARLGLESYVHLYEKFITDSEVAYYFSAADLVVQPYKTATQSGVTQIAYHFDKPMIVTDVGGLAEMCPDGRVGYVVLPEAGAIADGIFRYFDHTDHVALQHTIAQEKQKYSWDILVQNIMNLAEQIDR